MDKTHRIYQELSKKRDDERVPYFDENGVMKIYTVKDLKEKLGMNLPQPVVPEVVKAKQAERAAKTKKKPAAAAPAPKAKKKVAKKK